MAEVAASDRTLSACLLYHPEAEPGTEVLVHVGFVVDILDRETALDARSLRAGRVPPASP